MKLISHYENSNLFDMSDMMQFISWKTKEPKSLSVRLVCMGLEQSFLKNFVSILNSKICSLSILYHLNFCD